MKKMTKVLFNILVSASLLFSSITIGYAYDRDEDEDVKLIVSQLISFYERDMRVDIEGKLKELELLSNDDYELWKDIINYWDWIENDMTENINVSPDNLSSPEKHAFIILGFALNNDGTMTDELIGRLEVGLNNHKKYPESYILVTGGVNKNGWTEGRRMSDWLFENGVPKDRIIIEEKAPDTAGNATNSFEMLYNDYDVDTVSIISSQYHLKRSSILYFAESRIKALELDKAPIDFLGEYNSGWLRPDKTHEDLSLKAYSLRLVAKVPNANIDAVKTEITGLNIEIKDNISQGDALEFSVSSIDTLGYNANITQFVKVNNFDPNVIGTQYVTFTYTENNKNYSEIVEIVVAERPSENISREVLGALISESEQRDLGEYTQKSLFYYNSSLENAKVVYANDKSDNESIIKAYQDLTNSITRLEKLVNVSSGKKVVSNANMTGIDKITDNVINLSNYWASMTESNTNMPAHETYYIIDLEDNYLIDNIKMFVYWGGSRNYQFDVLVSNNNEDWTKVVEYRDEAPATDLGISFKLENPIEGRYIKVAGFKTYVSGRPDINNIHVVETQIFGSEIDLQLPLAIEALKETLVDYSVLNELEYTPNTWLKLANKADYANILLNSEFMRTEDLNDVNEEIQLLMSLLTVRADKKELEKEIAIFAAFNQEEYTPESFKFAKDTSEVATIILNDENATQEDVNDIISRLKLAMNELVLKNTETPGIIDPETPGNEVPETPGNKNPITPENKEPIVPDNNEPMETLPSTGYQSNFAISFIIVGIGVALVFFEKRMSKQ